jgi:hypothetical protein
MAYTKLIPFQTKDARVEEISRDSQHYRLSVFPGEGDQYRLAQLDDYAKISRSQFPHRAPVSLSLSARASSDSIPGTWGFGFWNYPFGMSLGFGGTGWRLPTLPNAVWFFGASEENYLSFESNFRPERSGAQSKDEPQTNSSFEDSTFTINRASTTPPNNGGSAQRGVAANGFLAQSFRSPGFHPLLIPAGLALPFSRKTTRQLMSKVIGEDGIQLWSPAARRQMQEPAPGPQNQSVDPTQWHQYRLDWREERVAFEVDDVIVFESQVSPNPPLGLVIWIDNQYAAFTPEGKIGFGVLENTEPAWLEIKDFEVTPEASIAG